MVSAYRPRSRQSKLRLPSKPREASSKSLKSSSLARRRDRAWWDFENQIQAPWQRQDSTMLPRAILTSVVMAMTTMSSCRPGPMLGAGFPSKCHRTIERVTIPAIQATAQRYSSVHHLKSAARRRFRGSLAGLHAALALRRPLRRALASRCRPWTVAPACKPRQKHEGGSNYQSEMPVVAG